LEILFIAIDKTRDAWVNEALDIYLSRLKKYARVRMECITATRTLLEPAEQMRREAEALQKQLKTGDSIWLLDENGKIFDSVGFARMLEQEMLHARGRLVFVVGGPFGFDTEFAQGKNKISLSRMTFSHQMVRIFFVEQLYRAFTILRGEPYHHA
jgi:23S rRNA (pseudouridine1915-N3)-methyltransferase